MPEERQASVTRREFARTALGVAAAAVVGAGGLELWLRSRSARRLHAATLAGTRGINSLHEHAAARGLVFGAAVRPTLLDLDGAAAGHTSDAYTQLVAAQTGMLVDEYMMNWRWLRPSPDQFDFTQVDRLMRFADLLHRPVRGHVLCWHVALPGWFRRTANRGNARRLLTDHIHRVVGYLRGRVHAWNVVNEAVEPTDRRPDGLRRSPWLELIGPEYIELAFQAAAEADPRAQLAYNDFGIESEWRRDAAKRSMVLALVRRLQDRGVPIHAIGVQSHLSARLPRPGAGLQRFIREAADLGLEVHITELDVDCRGVAGDSVARDRLVADTYRRYLDLVLAEPNVPLVITWGLTSAYSWLNQVDRHQRWANLLGPHQRGLPFDDTFNPTPAFLALRAALDAAPARTG